MPLSLCVDKQTGRKGKSSLWFCRKASMASRPRSHGASHRRHGSEDAPLLRNNSFASIHSSHSWNGSAFSENELNCFARTVSTNEEKQLCSELQFYFLNPIEKWKVRRKIPWKLLLQIFKIIIVTIQLCSFGISRSSHVNFLETSTIAFKHIFLKGWEAAYETMPYPPAIGHYAIYTIPQFYQSVDHVLAQYNVTEKIAIGTYHYSNLLNKTPLVYMEIHQYRGGKIMAFNSTYDFNPSTWTDTIPINTVNTTNIEKYLQLINKSINFDVVIEIRLKFSLKTIHLRKLSRINPPDCYQFNITIFYENADHAGQNLINLKVTELSLPCHSMTPVGSASMEALRVIFDIFVIFVSILSASLCVRSVFRAQKLRKKTCDHLETNYSVHLTYHEQLEFVNLWYLLIILNDSLTILGSYFKIQIDFKESNLYEICSLMLGTGSLLVWIGVLRYLGFFSQYNILILTLKKSAVKIARFLLCAIVFYLGFTFCGWVVLGPYHIKFRTFTSASDCLFSLVNGDDMFVTFSAISQKVPYIWLFSKVYLYIFISLFIYVVLNVFISVIYDTYETIKEHYVSGFPKTRLQEFMERYEGEIFFAKKPRACHYCPLFCCCCPPHEDATPDEATNLLYSDQTN